MIKKNFNRRAQACLMSTHMMHFCNLEYKDFLMLCCAMLAYIILCVCYVGLYYRGSFWNKLIHYVTVVADLDLLMPDCVQKQVLYIWHIFYLSFTLILYFWYLYDGDFTVILFCLEHYMWTSYYKSMQVLSIDCFQVWVIPEQVWTTIWWLIKYRKVSSLVMK